MNDDRNSNSRPSSSPCTSSPIINHNDQPEQESLIGQQHQVKIIPNSKISKNHNEVASIQQL